MSSTVITPFRPKAAPGAEDGASPQPVEAVTRPRTGAPTPPLFSPDRGGDDRLEPAPAAGLLAELAAHRDAGTPFLIALFGPSGSGRSTVLGQMLEAVRAFSAAAGASPDGPFLPGIVTARVEASGTRDPAEVLRETVLPAVRAADAALAEEATIAGSDPIAAARAAGERVNDLRRSLDAERQALDEIGGRRARLTDAVLFDTPGSRIEAYARANRATIEPRLRDFGLPAPDAIVRYKELVRDVAEAPGGTSRFGFAVRALYGYKGQGTLLGFMVFFLLLGIAAAGLAGNPAGVEAWLAGAGDRFASTIAWVRGHLDWLPTLTRAFFALAAACLAVDLVRAARFVQPVFKGARLLRADLDGRRRDLDGLLAHQTRRVDQLTGDVEAATKAAEAADRRAGERATPPPAGGDDATGATPVEAVFAALSAAMGATTTTPAAGAAPKTSLRRVVVAIDELDRLPAAQAAAYLDAAHRLFGRPGFVTVVAVEREHVAAGMADADPALAASRLDRVIQLSYTLGSDVTAPGDYAARLLSPASVAVETFQPDAHASALDAPWRDSEERLVRDLAPFAGSTPRSVKRFVNTYRVARADPRLGDATPAELGGLAWALALDGSGAAAELGGLDGRLGDADPFGAQSEPALALAAARRAVDVAFTLAEARRGLEVARAFGRRG